MPLGGVELTKLIYSRNEGNLLRDRGDRLCLFTHFFYWELTQEEIRLGLQRQEEAKCRYEENCETHPFKQHCTRSKQAIAADGIATELRNSETRATLEQQTRIGPAKLPWGCTASNWRLLTCQSPPVGV